MNRFANQTIAGYIFQFNKAIKEVLDNNDETVIHLEGYYEDIDVFKKDETIAIQCKYYESSNKINDSDLSNPILAMMATYAENDSISFKIYFHYKDAIVGENITFEKEILDNILKTNNKELIVRYFPLIYTINDTSIEILSKKLKKTKEDSEHIFNYFKTNRESGTLQEKFNFDDILKKITIETAPSIYDVTKEIEDKLISLGHSEEEVKCIYYPNMFQRIAALSSNENINDRKIKRSEFLKEIFKIKTLITTKWLYSLYDREKYKKMLKQHIRIRMGSNTKLRFLMINIAEFEIGEVATFINDFVHTYSYKTKLHIIPLIIISNCDDDVFNSLGSTLYENFNMKFTTGIVCNKFYLDELFNDKYLLPDCSLRFCKNNDQLDEYILKNKPDDLYIIGDINGTIYETNGISVTYIKGLKIDEIKEVFYLGGNNEGNR